mgnify:CR=1 FL=1
MITAQEQAESLLRAGYTEVQTAGELHVGQRVRHVGQQYPEAIREGTAVIERIFTRGKDVELIARRDKPEWGPNDTHGFWANYHTAPVHNHLKEAEVKA